MGKEVIYLFEQKQQDSKLLSNNNLINQDARWFAIDKMEELTVTNNIFYSKELKDFIDEEKTNFTNDESYYEELENITRLQYLRKKKESIIKEMKRLMEKLMF